MKYKIAIIQYAPIHLDIKACIQKAIEAINEAAAKSAKLIVFGETWFSGYPSWLDYCQDVAFWNHQPMKKVFSNMLNNSLQRESEDMRKLQKIAKGLKISIVLGANEVDLGKAKGTIFNSLFSINESGIIVNHHRKLVPTFTEKLIYGQGDGAGLKSSLLCGANVTASVCWEHWMPMTRQALHNSLEQIHIAAWPKVHEMHQIASRQYAFEGRCFVIAAGQMFHSSNFPNELKKSEELEKEDKWVLNGGSCVIGPDGYYVVDPVFDKEEIIYADLDLSTIQHEAMTLDVSGHYQRDDIFTFTVNKKR